MTEPKCAHRYIRPVIDAMTHRNYAVCVECNQEVEGIAVEAVADMPKEISQTMEQALDQMEVDIPAFTPEDTQAIATLPLTLIKPVVTKVQFDALTKFVTINSIVMGLKKPGEVFNA